MHFYIVSYRGLEGSTNQAYSLYSLKIGPNFVGSTIIEGLMLKKQDSLIDMHWN